MLQLRWFCSAQISMKVSSLIITLHVYRTDSALYTDGSLCILLFYKVYLMLCVVFLFTYPETTDAN